MEENTEVSTGEQQMMSAIDEQALAFEKGISKIADDAFKAGMHPLAVALAGIRMSNRIAATIATTQGLSDDEWEDMVRSLFDGVVESMKTQYGAYGESIKAMIAEKNAGVSA